MDLRRSPARMQLQGNNSVASYIRIVQVHTEVTVESCLNFTVYSKDFVLIPVIRFYILRTSFVIPQPRPAVFLVKLSPIALADICLWSANMSARQSFTPKLYTAVALFTYNPYL